MGTYYEFSGRFVLKRGATHGKVLARVKGLGGTISTKDVDFSELSGGITEVAISVSNHMSYSGAEEIDEHFISLANEFGDFSRGPAECRSAGEDYPNGPHRWYVGPAKAAIRSEIRDELKAIKESKEKIAMLRAALKKAGKSEITSTL